MATLVFGADGGGTKTDGVLATREDKVLARCQTGASNPNVVGVEDSASTLWGLITTCCQQAGCVPGEIEAAVLGLAGAGSPAIRDRLLNALRKTLQEHHLTFPHLVVESDARIALEGAFSGRPGAVVIAGTGSVVLGKTTGGEIVRIGGWGRVLGDEGSGYWIGLEAARAITRHFDGLERAGLLCRSIIERFGWATREAVIVAVYQQEFPLASIAPLVLDASERGDLLARSILERAAELLAGQVLVAARQVEARGEVGVVFLGGLIDHETPYARILIDRLASAGAPLRVQDAELSPADGALLMARARLDPTTTSDPK
jgi:N-acetylglucosamine kinase-like BadF-type ATPase